MLLRKKKTDDIVKTVKVKINGIKVKVNIKKNITYFNWVGMVNDIVDLMFDDVLDTVNSYRGFSLDFAQRLIIIQGYTDFNFTDKDGATLPAEDVWKILKCSRLYEKVAKFVGEDVNRILSEANSIIDARVRYLANKTDINTLINKFSNKLDSFGTQFTDMDAGELLEVIKKFQGMSSEKIIDSMVKTVKKGATKK